MGRYVIGVDPGPVCGIVRLCLAARQIGPIVRLSSADALQVTPGALFEVLQALSTGLSTSIAVERFVVGPRAARSSTAKAGQIAREIVAQIEGWAGRTHVATVHTRSAAEVKPWATDTRLDRAGLLGLTKGMRHARDGGRHALYLACNAYGLPDPLSRKGTDL